MMDADLRELYQEVILDHNRHPRNAGSLPDPDCTADGYNPLCGDKVRVFVSLQEGRIADVRFEGVGCAISTASASLMTEAVKGRSIDEVDALFEQVHRMLTEEGADVEFEEDLESLTALAGVREFPIRVKCASLSWHTLQAALKGRGGTTSTEAS